MQYVLCMHHSTFCIAKRIEICEGSGVKLIEICCEGRLETSSISRNFALSVKRCETAETPVQTTVCFIKTCALDRMNMVYGRT